MGVFSFAKNIGDKLFNRDGLEPKAVANAPVNVKPAQVTANTPSASDIAGLLLRRVQANARIDDLKITYNGDSDTAEIHGRAQTVADREKAILALGNVQYVARVVDSIMVIQHAPESTFYVVESGDTLSKIAKRFYGDASLYSKIFESNQPLLSDPDKIYIGQTLRIPPR